jgi:hypothetical protein
MELAYHLARILLAIKDPARAQADVCRYLKLWIMCLEDNIREIEAGDRQGFDFFSYEFDHWDPVCSGYILKGSSVSRAEINLFPEVVPPFHIGCSCRLKRRNRPPSKPEGKKKNVFYPLFLSDELPMLPDWRERVPFPS